MIVRFYSQQIDVIRFKKDERDAVVYIDSKTPHVFTLRFEFFRVERWMKRVLNKTSFLLIKFCSNRFWQLIVALFESF